MNEKLERAVQTYRQGGRASVAAATIDPVLAEMDTQIDEMVFNKLEQWQGLTPEVAIQAWMARHANWKLKKMLARNVKRGSQASLDIAPVLNGDKKP